MAGLSIYRGWTQAQRFDRLQTALQSTPGLHVTEIVQNGAEFTVRGLRDPLASTVSDVATAAELDPALVTADMQPFQSLQPPMIESRASKLLAPPPSVQLSVRDSTLVVSGSADSAWRQQAETRFALLAGISSLDISGLAVTDAAAMETAVSGIDAVTVRADQLDQKTFRFTSGVELSQAAAAELKSYVAAVQTLRADAATIGYIVDVTLYGSTDTTGDDDVNEGLAIRRASVIAEILADHDIAVLSTERLQDRPGSEAPTDDASWRFVRAELSLRPAPSLR